MNISVSEAKAQLTELVRRAEVGEDVVLTRHGRPVARLMAVRRQRLTTEERGRIIEDIQREAAERIVPGPLSGSNHDDLYDEHGLPK